MTASRVRQFIDIGLFFAAIAFCLAITTFAHAQTVLLNVSYDPTRELYKEFNAAFAADWKAKNGATIAIRQSHNGSGASARAVIDGLAADVVTLALAADIDEIAKRTGKIPLDWQKRLPNNSSPYTSTIMFLVRKGNPKQIKDWGDLAKPGVQVITPNPKTSGAARWNYLAAWAWADREYRGDKTKVREYIAALLRNVPVLDTGARGATTSFVQRELGDVLLNWENEAYLALEEFGPGKYEIVSPSMSILAEPPVTVVDGNAGPKNQQKLAESYLQYLYSPVGQAIAAKHYFRPTAPEHAKPEDMARFKKLDLVNIDKDFGGWTRATADHFAEGASFDQLYGKR